MNSRLCGVLALAIVLALNCSSTAPELITKAQRLRASGKREDVALSRQLLESCVHQYPAAPACWLALASSYARDAKSDPQARRRAEQCYERYLELAAVEDAGHTGDPASVDWNWNNFDE